LSSLIRLVMGILSHGLKGCPIITHLAGGEKMRFFWRLHTGGVIQLEAGTHTITLEKPKNFSPIEQDVNPSGTSPIQPHKIYFSKV